MTKKIIKLHQDDEPNLSFEEEQELTQELIDILSQLDDDRRTEILDKSFENIDNSKVKNIDDYRE